MAFQIIHYFGCLLLVMQFSMASAAESVSPRLTIWRGNEAQAFASETYEVAAFDRAVMSWNCDGPADFELEVGGERYLMGRWSDKPQSKKTDSVAIDTLELKKPSGDFCFHVKPAAGTHVTLVAVTHWLSSDVRTLSEKRSPAWGKTLDVPPRSQRIEDKDSGSICSPTSLSMVLEYDGCKKSTREVADGVFDHTAKMYGNWPFNTAYAHRASGFETYVVSAAEIEELEAEIAAGRPVVTSHQWKRGELTDSSIPLTAGHLIAVVGFTDDGDVVVNDPAAKPDAVRRTYKRSEFFKTWVTGIMYVVKPK